MIQPTLDLSPLSHSGIISEIGIRFILFAKAAISVSFFWVLYKLGSVSTSRNGVWGGLRLLQQQLSDAGTKVTDVEGEKKLKNDKNKTDKGLPALKLWIRFHDFFHMGNNAAYIRSSFFMFDYITGAC